MTDMEGEMGQIVDDVDEYVEDMMDEIKSGSDAEIDDDMPASSSRQSYGKKQTKSIPQQQ